MTSPALVDHLLQAQVQCVLRRFRDHHVYSGPGAGAALSAIKTPRLVRMLTDDSAAPVSVLESLERLHGQIMRCPLGQGLDIITLERALEPFLGMLQHDEVTCHIVEHALDALAALLVHGEALTTVRERERQSYLYRIVMATLTQCRFAPSDSSHDEVALLKTTILVSELAGQAYFDTLPDAELANVLESLLAVVYLPRFSDQLRLGAERSLLAVVDILMARWDEMPELTTPTLIPIMDCFNSTTSERTVEPGALPHGRAALAALLACMSKVYSGDSGPAASVSDKRRDRIRQSTLLLLQAIITRHGGKLVEDAVIGYSSIGDHVWRALLQVFRCTLMRVDFGIGGAYRQHL